MAKIANSLFVKLLLPEKQERCQEKHVKESP